MDGFLLILFVFGFAGFIVWMAHALPKAKDRMKQQFHDSPMMVGVRKDDEDRTRRYEMLPPLGKLRVDKSEVIRQAFLTLVLTTFASIAIVIFIFPVGFLPAFFAMRWAIRKYQDANRRVAEIDEKRSAIINS